MRATLVVPGSVALILPTSSMISRATSGLPREVHEARVGQAALLGPLADRAHVDGDHRRHERALVAERHRLADVGAELQLVLDELRRERRAVGELAHVLGAVDDGEMAARVDRGRHRRS